MEWLEFAGEGHALTGAGDEPGTFNVACGREVTEVYDPDIREAIAPHARPFAADTCRPCHMVVKFWASHPEEAPEFLTAKKPREEPRGRMSAADRRAAISGQGEAKDGPPVKSRATLPDPDDDLEFPDEPVGGPPVVSGAVVVPPKRASRKKVDDDGIDS